VYYARDQIERGPSVAASVFGIREPFVLRERPEIIGTAVVQFTTDDRHTRFRLQPSSGRSFYGPFVACFGRDSTRLPERDYG